MADETTTEDTPPKKRSKMPIILGFVLALLGGGGGFFLTSKGLIGGSTPSDSDSKVAAEKEGHSDGAKVIASIGEFIAVDPVVVNLPPGSKHALLRFSVQLEVAHDYASEVEQQLPRVTDILNTYLRAVDPADLEGRAALLRIRSHLRARLDVVLGPDRVQDILIMEFILT